MDDPNSILSMSRHAGFVWPTYAISLVVLGGLAITTLRSLKRARTDLDAAEAALAVREGEDDEA